MVFSSLSFLIVFVPILAVFFFIIPAKIKNARQYVLLAFSLLFYGSGESLYIFLIAICILISWCLSKYVNKQCKWALVLSILINVIPLVVTKYSEFIIINICRLFGETSIVFPNIVMPIGISFYTFQVITYIVDLYNNKVERQKNLLLFALYIMFFPQLIAGPIVKYSEVVRELENPDVTWDNIKYGTGRFIRGIGKKVLIANQVGYITSSIQGCGIDSLSTGMAWLCVIAYTIQIYFDFSGYSEMAIGLGAIFGFHFPENFNDPYASRSVSEFWRRWHITLGRFFREYIYIPLGGNRVKKTRWIINIFIVWMLTGLWHGGSWNYVIWGLYYGVLLIIERITGIEKKLPKAISWIVTQFFVSLGWGIFMCDKVSVYEIMKFLAKLLFISDSITNTVTIGSLNLWGYIPFLVIGVFLSSPLWVAVIRTKLGEYQRADSVTGAVSDIYLIIILLVALMFLMGGTYNPFIYFRF